MVGREGLWFDENVSVICQCTSFLYKDLILCLCLGISLPHLLLLDIGLMADEYASRKALRPRQNSGGLKEFRRQLPWKWLWRPCGMRERRAEPVDPATSPTSGR